MPPHPVLVALSLLCGGVAGLAVNRLLKLRLREQAHFGAWPDAAGALRDPGPPRAARRWGSADRATLSRRRALLLNPLLLAAFSVALSLLPGLRQPVALSQALLLLYLLYPLALVDFATLTVEPGIVLGGIVLRLAVVIGVLPGAAADMLAGLLAGAGLLALVGFAYRWLRDRDGLGEGDAAVLGLIGAFVGWQGLLPVVLLATASGLLAGLPALLLLRKPLLTPLPFVPFLCAAGMTVYLAQAHGWSLYGLLPALD